MHRPTVKVLDPSRPQHAAPRITVCDADNGQKAPQAPKQNVAMQETLCMELV